MTTTGPERAEAKSNPTPWMPTGVPGLDLVLSGGLLRDSVYILEGPPGAGKTLLANQIGFHRARQGETMLYMTLLAEDHHRMLRNIGGMSFFSQEIVDAHLRFMSGFDVLNTEGLRGILKLIRSESSRSSASLLVIDGVYVIEDHAGSRAEFRTFINELESMSSLLGCTVLLLTSREYDSRLPHYTMVDGWIRLDSRSDGHRWVRELTVRKFRGSGFIGGPHVAGISDDGIRILPRLESLPSEPYPAPSEFVPSGVPDLDRILGGGIPSASTTIVVGASGSGKTSLGLSFLGECTAEEPGLYAGFGETPERLQHKSMKLGLGVEHLHASGPVDFMWMASEDTEADILVQSILEAVERRGVRRLVVDGLQGLSRNLTYPERLGPLLAAASHQLRRRGVTTLMTADAPQLMGGELALTLRDQASLSENIILLRYLGLRTRMRRTLSVIKARDQDFDPSVFEFTIGSGGIRFVRSLAEGDDDPGESSADVTG
ncbi:MAG: AAA family ATPase [Gemmatimonadales bacterium]|nr:MAG: AAA family ATPase [Gemmatimonadales bacterium]